MIALRWNHSVPRSIASLLTAVGFTRVSIGPPMSVIERGAKASCSSSIRATAASTGTEGWHNRHDVRVGAERVQHVDHVINVVVEIEGARGRRYHGGINPIGDVDVAPREHRLDRTPKQSGIVARHGSDDEEPRLWPGLMHLLPEVEQVTEGARPHDLLGHLHGHSVKDG